MEAFNPNLNESLAVFEAWFDLYESICSVALTIPCEEIDTNPLRAARSIAQFVDLKASEAEIAEYASRHSKSTVLKETECLVRNAPEIPDIDTRLSISG